MKLRIPLGCWISLVVAGMLVAQEPADPPSRVARLNYLEGSVSFRPGIIEEWAPATLNYPLTTGDHLWVDQEARAELHIGATAIHLAPQTAFAILNLDDRVAQMTVAQGTLYLRVPRMEDDEIVELDTPNGATSVLETGDYRIDVDPQHNATSITVRAGRAEVSGNGRIFTVRPGRMLQLVADDEIADILQAPEPDPWEDWCVGRDQLAEYELEISGNYVAPEITGAEDLAEFGDWSTDTIYGAVWVPRAMPAGWAPYRYGHWAYGLPWGWTWIDDAPWGFAPFHYGRWERTPFGWEWLPGKRAIRPVYAPALVVFVAGSGLSVSGAARVGRVTAWIPLGPGEIFHPTYRVSEQYLRRVNDGNQTEVSYINPTSMTAVPQAAFVGARPVKAATLRLPPGAVANVKAVTVVDANPSRESYLGRRARAGTKVPAPPPQIAEWAVFATPIRSAQSTSGNEATMAPQPATPSTSNPPPRDPSTAVERLRRQDEPLPAAALVYVAPAPVYTPPPQHREESRSTPPPQRHEELRLAPPPPTYNPPSSPRREESRPAAPPPARTGDKKDVSNSAKKQ